MVLLHVNLRIRGEPGKARALAARIFARSQLARVLAEESVLPGESASSILASILFGWRFRETLTEADSSIEQEIER